MKKLVSITLCLVMVMTMAASAFAMGLGIAPPEEMLAWFEKIDSIGEVTQEDGDAIDALWAHYNEYGYGMFVNVPFAPSGFKDYYAKLQQITEAYDALPEAPTPSEPTPTIPEETKPVETTPTVPEETKPSVPAEPVDPAGDNTFMVIAMVVLSMTAMVVLVSKKRMF
jgi:hypothetical protein